MKRNLLITACTLSITLFFYYISGRTTNVTHGFSSYYTFSRLFLEEKDFSKAYDTAYFNSKIRDFGIAGVRDLPNNIPTSSLMYVPVAFFSPVNAKIIWTVISVLFYLISAALLFSAFEVNLSSTNGLILIIISFLYLPVYHGIELGQAYVLLLFLFSLSLYGFKKENLLLTSVPLALMLVFKSYGVFPLIFFALLRKWKMLSTVLLISIIIIVIAIPLTGFDVWDIYFNDVLFKMAGNEYASHTAYQTVNSFVKHILNLDLSLLIIVIIALLALLFFYIRDPKKSQTKLGNLIFYSSFASINVIFAPLAEDYHYALVLPLIFGTGKIIIDNYRRMKTEAITFIVSLFLLSVPFNYKALNDVSFPMILLAYPRLYGGLLLVILYIIIIRKESFKKTSYYETA